MIAQTGTMITDSALSSAPPLALLFVYNADSGVFNLLADIGHKLFSPESYPCDLCALTHGLFRERSRWRAFVEALPVPCEFLHRDQFRSAFPRETAALPAVFRREAAGLVPCLGPQELAACSDLETLERLVRTRCLGGG